MATYWENSCSFGLRYVSWYKYLIVSLVFSHLGFWSGNLFLIAPFPDLCLLVPPYDKIRSGAISGSVYCICVLKPIHNIRTFYVLKSNLLISTNILNSTEILNYRMHVRTQK